MRADAAPTPVDDGNDPQIGTEIAGRYVIHEPIARGGMGTVYRGVHVELGRPVAIKVLKDTYARDPEAVRRFQREAQTASRIDHPNIVAILDLGRLETGEPYLVMEVLEGKDLADVIAEDAPLSPARVLEILKPVASALDAVHREGLLHRDIKPANIFLASRPDGSVAPKLLDFGLAALREPSDNDKLTREGIVVGTPHYVSPEAAEGDAVDERTDVYSLGLVAFEMLSGVLPIDGQRPMSLLYAKVRRPAPTLSQRTGKSFPPPLEQLIARTLSRTPSKRPESAGAFVRELASIVESLPAEGSKEEPPKPRTPSRSEPSARVKPSDSIELPLERRGRALSIALAVLLLGVLGGVGVWALSSHDGAPEQSASAPVDPPRSPDPVPPEPAREPPVEPTPSGMAIAPPADPPPARATTPRRAPHASDESAPAPSTAPAAPPASEHAPPPSDTPDRARAEALTHEGGTALLRGQFPRARQLFQQATYADTSHAPAWRGLGLASERMGMIPEARHAYRRYLALAPTASDAAQVRARMARMEGATP